MADVVGYELVGEDEEYEEELGAAAAPKLVVRKAPAKAGALIRLPAKPAWRQRQLSPGNEMIAEHLYPLPMTDSLNSGKFDPTHAQLLFTGRPQKPFKGERLVISYARPTTSAGVLIVVNSLLVGTDLQAVEIGDMPADAFGPTSVGVRLSMKQAAVGNEVSIRLSAIGTIAPGDVIPASVVILGQTMA